jgi:hypothetical protein
MTSIDMSPVSWTEMPEVEKVGTKLEVADVRPVQDRLADTGAWHV